jgi:molybdopterin-guanine dinucleotide biosynthesis protein B
VVASAPDSADRLPVPTRLPLLDLNDPPAVAAFLMQSASRYEYTFPDNPA